MKKEIRHRITAKPEHGSIRSIDGIQYYVGTAKLSVTIDGAPLENCVEANPECGYAIVLDVDENRVPKFTASGELGRRAILGNVQAWVEVEEA